MSLFHVIRNTDRITKNIEKGYVESWKTKQKERLKIKIRGLKLFPIGVDLIIVDYLFEVVETFGCHGCYYLCDLKINQSISCSCGRKYCDVCRDYADDQNFFDSVNCPTNPSGWVLIDDCHGCQPPNNDSFPAVEINTQIYFKLI